ncbi:zinc finger protein 277 [Toxorhynchites rutilus septentrionalis]|uniref:zinc finger protein 277 n=1 Tax=Toxorhynchites rutilus septentrionalis TaxID=329112 RepID=UPI0024794CA1|nr:zinc finger protein 277 [Toxorhynchites rutilus septentrionalis]
MTSSFSNAKSKEFTVQSVVTEPLYLVKDKHCNSPATRLTDDTTVVCMFCDNAYNFQIGDGRDQYLAHLYMIHRLVIADVEQIGCLASYSQFWKEKFREHPVEKFCTSMLLNQLPDGTPGSNEKYFLLSDVEPLDYELRLQIKRDMVELVLVRHQFERTDRNFNRGCLYCRVFQAETRTMFIEHLYTKHFLLLGRPENLVFVDELINVVQTKIEKLVCLYCEKIFKDRPTLKEHMRKKGHKRINPDNKFYDRFFLVNYRNDRPQKPLATKQPIPLKERVPESSAFHSDDSDSDWSGWCGEEQQVTCLFCSATKLKIEDLKIHMKSDHSFDFDLQVEGLSIYQRVKVVNYVRHQILLLKCVVCREEFSSKEQLLTHLQEAEHFAIGEQQFWDQPMFFFPIYEDDQFLCQMEDDSPDLSDDSSVVISENMNARVSTEAETLSLEKLSL